MSYDNWGWARLKMSARNSIQVSLWVRGPQLHEPLSAASQDSVSRQLDSTAELQGEPQCGGMQVFQLAA